MSEWNIDTIDLAMVREFSTAGVQLTGPVSSEQRRERIRVEIWRNKRAELPFYDSGMTYAQAYKKCYGKALELRSSARDEHGRPVNAFPIADDDDDEDDEEESDDSR
jgi:hypothetical protein